LIRKIESSLTMTRELTKARHHVGQRPVAPEECQTSAPCALGRFCIPPQLHRRATTRKQKLATVTGMPCTCNFAAISSRRSNPE
jgi:hypothetical protein